MMMFLFSTLSNSDQIQQTPLIPHHCNWTQSHHSFTTTANMSLSDLPTEIIVHLFRSVDNIRPAAVLSQISGHLHSVWRYNLSSIYDSVLPREIECYDQARQLLEARAQSDVVVGESSRKSVWTTRQKGRPKVRKTAAADPILACFPRFWWATSVRYSPGHAKKRVQLSDNAPRAGLPGQCAWSYLTSDLYLTWPHLRAHAPIKPKTGP